MPAEPHIDFAYLDADKGGYIAYWEELVPRMRQGGVIAVDNVLFHGGVTDPEAAGPAAAIKEFNEHVSADARMDSVLLTVSDRPDALPQAVARQGRRVRPATGWWGQPQQPPPQHPPPPPPPDGAGAGRGGAAHGHRGEQLHGVVVARGAGGRVRGLGHGTAEFERVAAGAAAEFIARHGLRLEPSGPHGYGLPGQRSSAPPPRSSRMSETTRAAVCRTASVSVRKCQ
ncbi:tRNA 5-hydroxyuridine methyltransferase [Streptomyces microflavus]